MIKPLSATALKAKLETDEPLQLIDVRETHEYEQGHIPNSLHVALSELPNRFQELDNTTPVVLYCHFGKRSLMAAHFLQQAGFEQLHNLEGGIDAWSCEIDPSIARY